MIIRPQPGPQETFLKSAADIAIFGGAAGGGKSWALLIEALRHTGNAHFGGVVFRRTSPQITNEGALWDEAGKLYPAAGAVPKVGDLLYKFPSGATISFSHLQHEDTKLNWQGSQIPFIGFDEVTHFSKSQFFYMLSRNRSMCGVRPYVRATCNPDADSWVAEFIAWWIDQDTGLAIPERGGVLRWFVRINDALIWGDTREELLEQYPEIPPKSVTFIPAKLTDNKALMAADPGYLANLMALPLVDRERLLGGNWKIRPSAGMYFRRGWCEIVDAVPSGLTLCRGWDLAATPKTENNDPDWTCGTLIGKTPDKQFYVLDHTWLQGTPSQVETLIRNTASQDGRHVAISLPQDPAQSGKAQALAFIRMLAGYNVSATTEARNPGGMGAVSESRLSAKVTRFAPFSAQAEAGNVRFLRGPWNTRLFDELEAFPEVAHDDAADSISRSFAALIAPPAPARVQQLRL